MRHDGKPRHVFVFSHTLGTHHLAYSRLACALVASGALVYCVFHSDRTDIIAEKNVIGLCRSESDCMYKQLVAQESCLARINNCVKEIVRVIQGVADGEFLEQLHAEQSELQAFLFSGPKISLCGHGLGASTMLAVALKEPTLWPLINSIIAFDTWPLCSLDSVAFSNPTCTPSNIRVLLVNSEEWRERRMQSMDCCQLEKQFVAVLGHPCATRTHMGTDYTTITDMGFLTPPIGRKRPVSKKS